MKMIKTLQQVANEIASAIFVARGSDEAVKAILKEYALSIVDKCDEEFYIEFIVDRNHDWRGEEPKTWINTDSVQRIKDKIV